MNYRMDKAIQNFIAGACRLAEGRIEEQWTLVGLIDGLKGDGNPSLYYDDTHGSSYREGYRAAGSAPTLDGLLDR